MRYIPGVPSPVREPEKVNVVIFRENIDPHERTAVALFGECDGHDDPRRSIGKTVNYAVGYGAGPKKLAQVLSLEGHATTATEAAAYLGSVQNFYKRLFRWAESQKIRAKEYGGVTTLAGRRRHLKGAFEQAASWKAMQYGERQAVNSIIQGSAADVIRRGMLAVANACPQLRTLAQIHDEAIWEYELLPDDNIIRTVKECMETGHGFDLKVPLVFEPMVCNNWSQKGEGVAVPTLEEENRKS